MILSDVEIKEAIKKGDLVFEPELARDQIGAASVDLTLSGDFWVFKREYVGKKLDLTKIDFRKATEKVVAERMELKPAELVLGRTIEKIRVAPDLMGTLEGRSTYARMGLAVHVTSALVQPGSDNRQVLEIVNMSPNTLIIHKGMRISQVVFSQLGKKTSKPYAKFGKVAIRQ